MSNIILPGDKPKTETTTELIKVRDNQFAEKSNHFIKMSGEAVTPNGMVYVGSFAAHMYMSKNPNVDEFSFITQAPIGGAHEVWCDLAHKGLKERLMNLFGRNAPRKVKR